MKNVPFKSSRPLTLGVELEYQIIDPLTFDLMSRAKDLMRSISITKYSKYIKPEITQSMIEINSSIHKNISTLTTEFYKIHHVLSSKAKDLGIRLCGGGTHPFQKWSSGKIFPTKRFKNLSRQYQYLSKRSTVFGLHIHIGCKSGEDALYLTHALSQYAAHFIALSASSPFYEGVDTGYHMTRITDFNAFPSSGYMPFLTTWREFSEYFNTMRSIGVLQSMKDVYWDIRPKPEFGTVEIRICDTPLTMKKAMILAAYLQALSAYLLAEMPITINKELYYLYGYHRFQASRYGYEGEIINLKTGKHILIADDILQTVKKIEPYAKKLQSQACLTQLCQHVNNRENDAIILKHIYKDKKSLPKVVEQQCILWENDSVG